MQGSGCTQFNERRVYRELLQERVLTAHVTLVSSNADRVGTRRSALRWMIRTRPGSRSHGELRMDDALPPCRTIYRKRSDHLLCSRWASIYRGTSVLCLY